MKCPLSYRLTTDAKSVLVIEAIDCLQEECAWWDKDQEQCAVMLLSTGLWVISKELRELKEKIPHEGQS